MLQVPEEALEKSMAGLIDLDLGLPVLGVASAALISFEKTGPAVRRRP